MTERGGVEGQELLALQNRCHDAQHGGLIYAICGDCLRDYAREQVCPPGWHRIVCDQLQIDSLRAQLAASETYGDRLRMENNRLQIANAAASQDLLRLQGVVVAARAYITVVGDDTKELDALVDAVAALDAR